ncbi:hypothetical protein BU14_0052s0038 [Porphyra umbilicalis]|uniref:Uncharacterized protein n=1 Tax=Porphyra umbilicalis TaxID=2786 RepID=A0A1X6PHU8_PORUM|nr:hypothetical protein BU14_0052s0038 [Porphyra umbilicalis]|eukprot:OSX80422.1 hypothetical protein BU14_0052s0038 [Porphyra umbilicalis]
MSQVPLSHRACTSTRLAASKAGQSSSRRASYTRILSGPPHPLAASAQARKPLAPSLSRSIRWPRSCRRSAVPPQRPPQWATARSARATPPPAQGWLPSVRPTAPRSRGARTEHPSGWVERSASGPSRPPPLGSGSARRPRGARTGGARAPPWRPRHLAAAVPQPSPDPRWAWASSWGRRPAPPSARPWAAWVPPPGRQAAQQPRSLRCGVPTPCCPDRPPPPPPRLPTPVLLPAVPVRLSAPLGPGCRHTAPRRPRSYNPGPQSPPAAAPTTPTRSPTLRTPPVLQAPRAPRR